MLLTIWRFALHNELMLGMVNAHACGDATQSVGVFLA